MAVDRDRSRRLLITIEIDLPARKRIVASTLEARAHAAGLAAANSLANDLPYVRKSPVAVRAEYYENRLIATSTIEAKPVMKRLPGKKAARKKP